MPPKAIEPVEITIVNGTRVQCPACHVEFNPQTVRRQAPRRQSATFYKWKGKYGGLDVSDAKRLKALEDENNKLKKLLAGAMLDNAMLKEIAAKKW
jgi:Transposase